MCKKRNPPFPFLPCAFRHSKHQQNNQSPFLSPTALQNLPGKSELMPHIRRGCSEQVDTQSLHELTKATNDMLPDKRMSLKYVQRERPLDQKKSLFLPLPPPPLKKESTMLPRHGTATGRRQGLKGSKRKSAVKHSMGQT